MFKKIITGINNIGLLDAGKPQKLTISIIPVILIYTLTAVIFAIDPAFAQNGHYAIDPPPFLEQLEIKPEAAALADLNNDNYQDLILFQRKQRPQIWLYSETDNGYTENNIHRLDKTYNNVQTLRILNINQDTPQKELMIGVEDVWQYESGQDTFVTTPVPNSIAGQANIGDISFGDINNNGLLDAIISRDGGGFSKNFTYLNFLELNGRSSSRNSDSEIYDSYHSTSTSYLYHFNKDDYIDYFSIKNRDGQNLPDEYFLGSSEGFKEQRTSQLHFGSDSYSAAIGDYNNDGHPDIYQTNYRLDQQEYNRLFKNNGDGSFSKISVNNSDIIPVLDNVSSRNAMWGDFDNDGDLDLLVAEYHAGYEDTDNDNDKERVEVSCSLYRNDGGGEFSKMSDEPIMIQPGHWTNAFFHDYNRDGKLDIIATGTSDNRRIQFYKNTSANLNWLQFTLQQSNAFYSDAVGARLELTATINGQSVTQYREYNPYTGYFSQKPDYIHFGLNEASSAELTITWKTGQVTNHSFTGSELNQRHHITEPLAGKLTVDSDQPMDVLRAPLNESAQDTLRFTNAGKAEILINDINTAHNKTSVLDYSTNIAPQEDGWAVIDFSPDKIEDLGPTLDTLTITSDAINSTKEITFEIDGLTERISFEQITASGNPLINQSDSYEFSNWLHLNGDNKLDPILFRQDKTNQLFQSTTDSTYEVFTDALSGTGTTINGLAVGSSPDGTRMAVALTYPDRANELYIKNTNSQFEPYTPDILSELIKTTTSVSFYDFNGDVHMDLFFTNTSSQTNDLLINDKNGSYYPAEAGDLTSEVNNTTDHVIADLNNDNSAEIVTTSNNPNSSSPVNVFVSQSRDALSYRKAQIPNLTSLTGKVNQALTLDFNNDGLFDLLFLNDDPEQPVMLFKNEGDLNFSRVENETINNLSGSFRDVTLMDYNLDGFVDLFFANESYSEPNVLLETRGGTDFLKITTGTLVSTTNSASYGAGSIDYNQDGRPDLFITNNFDKNKLFLNNTGDNNWITVEVKGRTNQAQNAIITPNARVELQTVINQDTLVQQRIVGGSAARSSRYGKVYFGMLNLSSGNLTVTYPNGTTVSREVNQVNRNYTFEQKLVSIENDDRRASSVPEHTMPKLLPNYPNPFNATTHIRYYLPDASPIEIQIHSITGRKIQEWKFQRKKSGYHRLTFEAENLSSGTYLVTLQSLNRRQTKKIMLLK